MPSIVGVEAARVQDRFRTIHTGAAMDLATVAELDLRRLRQFVAVAEELHFTRAAERLHLSQPALSARIRELEERLGVRLLERTSRSVALTDAGALLLERARPLLLDAEATLAAVRGAGGIAVPLRVGLMGTAGAVLFPPIRERLLAERPGLQIEVRVLQGAAGLLRGEVDVALCRLDPDLDGEATAGLRIVVLDREPRVLALASGHRLADRGSLTMADLVDEAFLTQPEAANPAWRDRWLAEQRRHGLPGRIAAEVGDAEELLALVSSGAGVCLVPRTAATHHARPGIAYVPVRDAEPTVTSVAWHERAETALVRAFVAAARAATAGRAA